MSAVFTSMLVLCITVDGVTRFW